MIPVLIIAAGGHAKVLTDMVLQLGREVIGLIDADPARHGRTVLGRPILGGDDLLAAYRPEDVDLVNGLGGTGDSGPRQRLFLRLTSRGYRFATVIDPTARIGREVALGDGVQVMPGAIIGPGTTLGINAIVNTRAVVDHDCRIGDHVHIAPGAVLSGGVRVGSGAHIGTGAAVRDGVDIGSGALVAAGAAVVADVAAGARVGGVPARPLRGRTGNREP